MFEIPQLMPNDRAIIINADDFGITHSTNQAIVELFENDSITSSSLMVPCTAAKEVPQLCSKNHNLKVGIHLTLTSTENYSLKPVFQEYNLESLVTDEGFFPKDLTFVEKNADPLHVKAELEAQILWALSHGVDVTHLDSHAGSVMGLTTGRDFLEIVFDLCEKYELPFNLPLQIIDQPFLSRSQKSLFEQRILSAKRRGIELIDDLIPLPYHLDPGENYNHMRDGLIRQIEYCKPGITQIVAHPAKVTSELQALTPHFKKRGLEFQLLNDPRIKHTLQVNHIKLISWEYLRSLQRSKKPLY
ncbi:polysaccharide deacetylase family protein [Paenibacillus sp. D2_2]|uniref:polysaccharide deacetylase family protein n=1 Tax=Paenibacillus sp. D2_2 TaxID=3073092 RepID=UPI0028165FA7|nr:polysaccharide deacetylase family protein [Paenibacillus sp. D2_2]WMT39006.1 polysaccharide deacetylase family protein [Paenibacillus sp. D2_2]